MTGTSHSRFFQPKSNGDNNNRTLEETQEDLNKHNNDDNDNHEQSSLHAVLTTVGSSAEDPLEIPDDEDCLPAEGNPLSFEFLNRDKEIQNIANDDMGEPDGIDLTNSPSSTEPQQQTVPDPPPPPQPANPFAQFAYQASAAPTSRPSPALSWRQSNTTNTTNTTNATGSNKQPDTKDAKKKRKQDNPVQQRVKKVKETNHFVPMASIPPDEQEKIRQKWQSLADPNAPLEVRRFQVLLAARLHARCQEPTVRKAMATLRQAFPALTVQEVAKADPEVLAHHITNLQYYNMKAKHLVQSSKEILERFHGIVPEDEQSLLQLTGIGRVFADLLSFVNTRAAHEQDSSAVMVQTNDDHAADITADATPIQKTLAPENETQASNNK